MVGPDRPQTTIRRMRIACGLHRATNKHSEYLILVAFPQQQWLYERASFFCCTFIACLVVVQACGRLGCVTGWHSCCCCCCCCCAFVSCTDWMTGVSRCCVKMANSSPEMSHPSRNRCSLTSRLKCVTLVMILVCVLGDVKFVLPLPFGD